MSHKQRRTVALTSLVLGLSFGCADQGEGERCDTDSGNQDCASGLVCTPLLTGPDESLARCCPPEGERISDDRCIQRPVTQTGEAGSTGASNEVGTGGQASPQGGSAGSSGAVSGAGGA